MLLPRSVRTDLLVKEWDVPRTEIAQAVRSNIKVKNQRRRTVNNMNEGTEKLEYVMQSAKRKLKRTLLFKKRPSKQTQELQEKADEVQKFLSQMALEEEKHELIELTENIFPSTVDFKRRISEASIYTNSEHDHEADRACGDGGIPNSESTDDVSAISGDNGSVSSAEFEQPHAENFEKKTFLGSNPGPIVISESD